MTLQQIDLVRLVGPEGAVEILGIRLVGMNAENGKKLLFTILFFAAVLLLSRLGTIPRQSCSAS